MPTNIKKGKGKSVSKKVDAPAADADDDLDDILAEVLAGDMPQLTADGGSLPAITASSSVSSNTDQTDTWAREISVSEATINDAVRRGDIAQLKRWERHGARMGSITPMLLAVGTRASDAVLKFW
jgi:hypothetical protein